MPLYRNAIRSTNGLGENWNRLLEYFGEDVNLTGFSPDQVLEEQTKARIILKDDAFAELLYSAEQHPYFTGQIRSALHYSKDSEENFNKEVFAHYWKKISALFETAKPKHGHLLRQALLTFGDYTLSVSEYKTLCIDNPNEGTGTPSMKRLFSNHGDLVKSLLNSLNLDDNLGSQLEKIITNSAVHKSDWRYCFIEFPNLFTKLSVSHLRLRNASGELLMVPNKSSSGFNYDVFLSALHESLEQHGIKSSFDGELGTWGNRYLRVNSFIVRFKKKRFIFEDANGTVGYETDGDDPIAEATKYILRVPLKTDN
jgi:hypothetical protein